MWKTAGVLSKYLCKTSEQSTFWAKQISDSGLRERFVPRNIVYTPDSVCLYRCQQSDCIKSFGRERVSTVLWFIPQARWNALLPVSLLLWKIAGLHETDSWRHGKEGCLRTHNPLACHGQEFRILWLPALQHLSCLRYSFGQ